MNMQKDKMNPIKSNQRSFFGFAAISNERDEILRTDMSISAEEIKNHAVFFLVSLIKRSDFIAAAVCRAKEPILRKTRIA
jgi:hypothetical protein